MPQAVVNIGMLGHVDHGKTSLVKAITGVWTDTHSEEIKRGITIKLGYADAVFKKCPKCDPPDCYTSEEKCWKCGGKPEVIRKISILDAPGHETLMTTAIAASSIIDGAILVIAANEVCPQPQTAEHLMVLDVLGVKNVVIVQNKVDLVTKEKAIENYNQIKKFIERSAAAHAPIVPVVANSKVNIDALIETIEKVIPTPKRDLEASPRLYIARSFDVNKPGTAIEKLIGGVIGGSLITGKLQVGDELELRPGLAKGEKEKETYEPVLTKITGLFTGNEKLDVAVPGGLIALGTGLDPSITKADGLVGNLAGKPGTLPPLVSSLTLEIELLKRVDIENPPLKLGEPLVLSVGASTTVGFVEKTKKNVAELRLKRPSCIPPNSKIAISRRIGQRWRLAGFAVYK